MPGLSRFRLLAQRVRQRLWFRPAAASAAAVAVAAFSASADRWWPADWRPGLADGAVDDLLQLMAASMLTVSTFSLSVLVTAFASAASAGTPRATGVVVADPKAQKAVAAFMASFIFSVVGLIALNSGLFGPSARFVLFLFAVAVLSWVIYAFFGWIETLTRIGRMSHTISAVENATAKALRQIATGPIAGIGSAVGEPPASGARVWRPQTGYLQYVDVEALQEVAEALQTRVWLRAWPGAFVHPRSTLAVLDAWLEPDDPQAQRLRDAFVVGRERTIEQDAAFGFVVLAEIAQRALSPAVNDPGTAVVVIASQARLLVEALDTDTRPPVESARVLGPATSLDALLSVAFDPVMRAGAASIEVQRQLMQSLAALMHASDARVVAAARLQAAESLARGREAGLSPHDLDRLAQELARAAPPEHA